MNQRRSKALDPNWGAWRRIGLALVLAGSVGACSSVPDWANPARLYDSVAGVFSSDEEEAFPTVSDVPDRPETSTPESRRETAQGLVADRENAQYTDDVIRREGEAQVAAVPRQQPETTPTAREEAAAAPRPAPPPREETAAPRPAPPPREETGAAPAAPAQVAQAPARPSLLEERRVAPRAAAPRGSDDSLDSRRTITSGRTTPPPPTTVESRRVPPRVVERAAPAAATPPRAVPRPAVTAQAAPAPRQVPPPVVRAAQDPAPTFVPAQPAVNVQPGGSVVSQTYARMLQDSASTVSTAPANAAFNAPMASPIQPGERPVAPIVADTYNAALAATQQTLGQRSPVQPASFQLAGFTSAPAATIQFGHDSATLNQAARAAVRRIADQYKASGGAIRVVGHASSKTKNMPVAEHHLVNFKISLDRAQAVASELARLGVPTEAIFVEARGASDPAFFESMPAGEAGNRRTEIFLDFSTS